jgi:hypothetical protein
MQPYVFPYLGYFQLVHAVDRFVFYDDVQFIKQGWIHRNRILVDGRPHRFTIPCRTTSYRDAIRSVSCLADERWRRRFETMLQRSYARAPHLEFVLDLVREWLQRRYASIGEMAAASVQLVCARLGIDRVFKTSSAAHGETLGLERAARLAAIAVREGCRVYVNAPGGRQLYSAADFAPFGVELQFLEPDVRPYDQGGDRFVPDLSVLDAPAHLPAAELRHRIAAARTAPAGARP